MMQERKGRFGHSHDPVQDYVAEVEAIEACARRLHLGGASLQQLQERISRALGFEARVNPRAVAAQERLRELADRTPAGIAEAVLRDVANERRRQITEEGNSREGDDRWETGILALAAGCYALGAGATTPAQIASAKTAQSALWPLAARWWKPRDRRRDLVRAAALLLAEIERMDRKSAIDKTRAESAGEAA